MLAFLAPLLDVSISESTAVTVAAIVVIIVGIVWLLGWAASRWPH